MFAARQNASGTQHGCAFGDQRGARRGKAQAGAVMVEALIGIAGLVLLFGCLSFLHSYGVRQITALQSAREAAWRRALNECNQSQPLFQELARDVIAGEVPIPEGWLPVPVHAQSSFQLSGLFGGEPRSGSKSVAFVCNPRPSRADPLSEPAGWVLGLFL